MSSSLRSRLLLSYRACARATNPSASEHPDAVTQNCILPYRGFAIRKRDLEERARRSERPDQIGAEPRKIFSPSPPRSGRGWVRCRAFRASATTAVISCNVGVGSSRCDDRQFLSATPLKSEISLVLSCSVLPVRPVLLIPSLPLFP